ncbi:hypothetical protein [Leeia sp.]|uniref:hypothetical protein n=1 Tax=Leeia sp. TaxID=2884678 RepID=UPI0035AE77C1
MPTHDELFKRRDQFDEWFGRALAIIHEWSLAESHGFRRAVHEIMHIDTSDATGRGMLIASLRSVKLILNKARHTLMLYVNPLNIHIDNGGVFEYFDEIRKIIESANTDLLFIDPYIDAEFVSCYMPHINLDVTVRILTKKKLQSLTPAAMMFTRQHGLKIKVREGEGIHDRYVIIDNSVCYQSGSSFKDGAKKAPTSIIQVIDIFSQVHAEYESRWDNSVVHIE